MLEESREGGRESMWKCVQKREVESFGGAGGSKMVGWD